MNRVWINPLKILCGQISQCCFLRGLNKKSLEILVFCQWGGGRVMMLLLKCLEFVRGCVLTLKRGWEKALPPDCCCYSCQAAHPCQAESPSFPHSCSSLSPAQSQTSTRPTTRPRWILSCCWEHRAGYMQKHTWAHLVKVNLILLAEEL